MTEECAGQGVAVEFPGHPVAKLTPPLVRRDVADALVTTRPSVDLIG
jgi:hypothetical protein